MEGFLSRGGRYGYHGHAQPFAAHALGELIELFWEGREPDVVEVGVVDDEVEGDEIDSVGEREGQGFAPRSLQSLGRIEGGVGETLVQVGSGSIEDGVDASDASFAGGVVDVFSWIFLGREALEGQLFAVRCLSEISVGLSSILSTTFCFAKTIFTMFASRVPDKTGCITFTIIFWP